MGVEARVGDGDEPFVKPLLVGAAFVTGYEKHRLSLRVEGESHTPYLTPPAKTQLLHVGVFRSVQCVNSGSTEARPELSQQHSMGEQFILQALRERLKFAVELVVEKYRPVHATYYGVKSIWRQDHICDVSPETRQLNVSQRPGRARCQTCLLTYMIIIYKDDRSGQGY